MSGEQNACSILKHGCSQCYEQMCQRALVRSRARCPCWRHRTGGGAIIEEKWWELPKIPYRPQYLELAYRLMETQPGEAMRHAEMLHVALDELIAD